MEFYTDPTSRVGLKAKIFWYRKQENLQEYVDISKIFLFSVAKKLKSFYPTLGVGSVYIRDFILVSMYRNIIQ